MPLNPAPPFPKSSGDTVRSVDWNALVTEVIRLDNDKTNRAGDQFRGTLSVGSYLAVGPVPSPASVPGRVWASGPGAEFAFLRRSLTSWPATPAVGDRWVWHNDTGIANLTTDGAGGVITAAPQRFVGINTPNPQAALDITAVSTTWSGWLEAIRFTRAEHGAITHPSSGLMFGLHSDRNFYFGDMRTGFYPMYLNTTNRQLVVNGSVNVAGSDLYFTETTHRHTGGGNPQGYAAIENAVDYDSLMILGRATPAGRKVSVWDTLTVNGSTTVRGQFIVDNGQSIKIGVPSGPYAADGIRGDFHLWLDAVGQVILKQGYTSRGMDLAERFPTLEPLEPGDVVVYDGEAGRVRRCIDDADRCAVGIVSGEPACIFGIDEDEVPIALCGRVPCKVDASFGSIGVGDLLVTSATPGHARAAGPADTGAGTVIGKALSALADGTGTVLALVHAR